MARSWQDVSKFDPQKFDEAMDFRRTLNSETDRGCALMASAYLEDQIRELLRARFVDDAKTAEEVLNEATGPLSTFSSRINLAYLLGLISPATRRELHIIRKIRNDFAHHHRPITFSTDSVASRCLELHAHVILPGKTARANFTRCVMGILAMVHVATMLARHSDSEPDFIIPTISDSDQDDLRNYVMKELNEKLNGQDSGVEPGQ
jgi:DNA-binding MltR family transcriptional regulator